MANDSSSQGDAVTFAFDLDSQAGVTHLLASIRASEISAEQKNELRDLVFLYTNGGKDQSVRINLEQRILSHQINPAPRSRKMVGVQGEISPEPNYDYDFGTARPSPAFKVPPKAPQPEIAEEPVTPADTVPLPQAEETPVTPVAPTIPTPEPVTPPTPEPVAPLSSVPEPPVIPNAPPAPEPVADADQNLKRIREIKSLVNDKVGNPVNLIDVDNEVGREYMNALLDAMKKLNSGTSVISAMKRLEMAYQEVEATLTEHNFNKDLGVPVPTQATAVPQSTPTPEPSPESQPAPAPAPAPVPEESPTPAQPIADKPDLPTPTPTPTVPEVPVAPPSEPEPMAPPVTPPPVEEKPEMPEPLSVPEPEPTPQPAEKQMTGPPPTKPFDPEPGMEPAPLTENKMASKTEPEPPLNIPVSSGTADTPDTPEMPKVSTEPMAPLSPPVTEKKPDYTADIKSIPLEEKAPPVSPEPEPEPEPAPIEKKIPIIKEIFDGVKESVTHDKTTPQPEPEPQPQSTGKIASLAQSEIRAHTPEDLPSATSIETSSVAGDNLFTHEVDEGLQQLLSEWSIFKKSGLFGTGPNGREHPLYVKIKDLQIPLLLAGRFEGSTQEVKQSITDYMNGWRYEQGIIYEQGENFDHYLRRVIRHIIDLQNPKKV